MKTYVIRIIRDDKRLEAIGIRKGMIFHAERDEPFFRPKCREWAMIITSKDGTTTERIFPREYELVDG